MRRWVRKCDPQFGIGGRDVDQDVVAVNLAGVDGDRLGGRQAERLAGAQVEARTVQVALDLAVAHIAFGQRNGGVGALVGDGVESAAAVHDGEVHSAAITRHLDRYRRLCATSFTEQTGTRLLMMAVRC